MHSSDTSADAAAIQHDAYRRMGPSGRFLIAAELTNAVRDLTRAGIRRRNPDYSDERIEEELFRIIYGPHAGKS